MAANGPGAHSSLPNMLKINVKWKGRQMEVEMDPQLASFMSNPDSDPETKKSILGMIFSDENENEKESCEQDDAKVHIWTEREERYLISLRTNLDDQFNKSKNHECLWGQIHKAVSESGIKVSKQQVLNKWKNLKKKYRETIDANKKTGNQKLTWKYEEEFNNLFGHRASTQATCTFDSGKKTGEKFTTCNEIIENKDSNAKKEDSSEGKEEEKKQKQRPLPKKRSSESLLSMFGKMESMNKDMRNQLERHQVEKMRRFDRLLDLFESSIAKSKSEEKD